jgi:hypothetical protein
LSPDVRATVTLVTRNLPWSDVLAAAAGSIGAAVEVMDSGIVRVVAASAPRRVLPAATALRPGVDPLGDMSARPRGERLVLRNALAPELPRAVRRGPHVYLEPLLPTRSPVLQSRPSFFRGEQLRRSSCPYPQSGKML